MKNYTNEQEAIRQSFANYLGALIGASIFEGQTQKENVIALLSEELTKYTCNEDNTINISIAKPILKSSLWILNKYKEDMLIKANQASININNSEPFINLNELINKLDIYIKNI